MIKKFLRNDSNGYYDLKITDKNNKSFIMTVGGNYDLFWFPENHKENRVFEIDKDDELLYGIFQQLFSAVEKRDDKLRPVLSGDKITFISEEWHEDESNKLEISRLKECFLVEFIKNENKEAWTVPHRGCAICFCNSGSRVPRVEQLFMRMFTYLAYECDLVKIEEDKVREQ